MRTRTKGEGGEIGIVASLPQSFALGFVGGPLELLPAVFLSDRLHKLRLLAYGRVCAMKFEQQRGLKGEC